MEARQGSDTQSQPNRRPKGPWVWGGVIKPVSWRIWSSTWVTASSCMTWPPRTNSRRLWATSSWTLASWAERKSPVTAPELSLVVFVGDMPTESHGPHLHLFCKSRTQSVLVSAVSSTQNSTWPMTEASSDTYIISKYILKFCFWSNFKLIEHLLELYQELL